MTPELEHLKERISEEILKLSRDLGENRIESWADYKFVVGRIRGLKTADGFIDDIMVKLERDDD